MRLLSVADLCRVLGVGRSTIWRWRRDGILPPPIELTPSTSRWPEDQIAEWLRAKANTGG